jgi:hypothetical protein
MNKIVIWIGSDIFDIFEVPYHTSPRTIFDDVMPKLREMFGNGVEIMRRNESNYEVNVDNVEV